MLYREWKVGDKIYLLFVERKWEIEIEWIGKSCYFGNGWNDFAKESKLEVGDTIVVLSLPSSSSYTLNVYLFEDREKDLDEVIGICILIF